MILNHCRYIYPYCVQDTIVEMYSKDITLVIFYCDLISCNTPASFSTLYQYAMVPTLVENSTLFDTCSFVNNYYD